MNKYKGRIGKRYKSFAIDTKELTLNSESRTISGYAAIFGNIDKSEDMLIKGCFAKSIQDRGPESQANDKIIMLWMHDMNEPIGRITTMTEDDKGLYFEAKIDDIDLGDRAISQLESGTLNQFSIGYKYVWDRCEWDNDMKAFIVKEVILYEISVVSIGCNGDTEYLGLKSDEDYDANYSSLSEELDDVCKNMSFPKRQKIERIMAKAMTLAASTPEKKPTPPASEEAVRPKSLFSNLILKMEV